MDHVPVGVVGVVGVVIILPDNLVLCLQYCVNATGKEDTYPLEVIQDQDIDSGSAGEGGGVVRAVIGHHLIESMEGDEVTEVVTVLLSGSVAAHRG